VVNFDKLFCLRAIRRNSGTKSEWQEIGSHPASYVQEQVNINQTTCSYICGLVADSARWLT